jgi:hypothetical protein
MCNTYNFVQQYWSNTRIQYWYVFFIPVLLSQSTSDPQPVRKLIFIAPPRRMKISYRSVLASSAVDRGFEPRSGQAKKNKIKNYDSQCW